MKSGTIKSLKELCDAVMILTVSVSSVAGLEACQSIAQAADRLKRVLDEEPNASELNRKDAPDDDD